MVGDLVLHGFFQVGPQVTPYVALHSFLTHLPLVVPSITSTAHSSVLFASPGTQGVNVSVALTQQLTGSIDLHTSRKRLLLCRLYGTEMDDCLRWQYSDPIPYVLSCGFVTV